MRYGIAVVVITFFAIVGTIVLVGSGNSKKSSTPLRNTVLADYGDKDTSSISWTQYGRLVGDDQRTAIRVTIARNKRTVEILSSYDERIEKSTEYINSPKAYESFVLALDNINFGKERNVVKPDDRGMCPVGNVFVYRLTDMGSEIMRTWSDTCNKTDGPYGGLSPALIAKLFKAQITDYNSFVNGVKL